MGEQLPLKANTVRTPEGDITLGTVLRNVKSKQEGIVIAVDVMNNMVRFESEDAYEATSRVNWKQLSSNDMPLYEIVK